MAWTYTGTIADFYQVSSFYGWDDGSSKYYTTPSTKRAQFSYGTSAVPTGSTVHSATITCANFNSGLYSGTGKINDSTAKTQAITITPGQDTTVTYTWKSNTGGSQTSTGAYHEGTANWKSNSLTVSYTPPYSAPSCINAKINGSTSNQYGASSGTTTLSWTGANGSYNAIQYYVIYRSDNSGAYYQLATTSDTSYAVSIPAGPGQSARFYVFAVGEFSNSAETYSPYLYAYSSVTAPSAVSLSSGSTMPNASVTLSWSGAENGSGTSIAYYSVQRSTSPTSGYAEIKTSTVSPAAVSESAPGTYYYKVKAISNVAGYDSGLSVPYATLTVANPKSTVTLDKSTITMDGASQITATVTRLDASYTHSIRWYINGTYTESHTVSGLTDTKTVPKDWCNAVTAGESSAAYCELTTYSSGAAIGTDTKGFTVAVPASEKPAVAIAFTGINTFEGLYLKDISSVTVNVATTRASSAAVTQITLAADGTQQTYASETASYTSNVYSVAGEKPFLATARDTRYHLGNTSRSIAVTDYYTPMISILECYRCDDDAPTLTANNDGTCIAVKASYTISAVGTNQAVAYKAYYRQSGTTAWSAGVNLPNEVKTKIATGISTDYAYDVKIEVTDKVGQTTRKQDLVSPSARLFDFRTTGAAFGRTAVVAKRFLLPPTWDMEYKGQTLDERFASLGHTHTAAAIGAAAASHNHAASAVTAGTFPDGLYTIKLPVGASGANAGSVNTLQILQSTANTDAFMTFHIAGDFAAHFGIDGITNDLFVGGFSYGTAKYTIWHAGNLNPISKAGDTMTGSLIFQGSFNKGSWNTTTKGALTVYTDESNAQHSAIVGLNSSGARRYGIDFLDSTSPVMRLYAGNGYLEINQSGDITASGRLRAAGLSCSTYNSVMTRHVDGSTDGQDGSLYLNYNVNAPIYCSRITYIEGGRALHTGNTLFGPSIPGPSFTGQVFFKTS